MRLPTDEFYYQSGRLGTSVDTSLSVCLYMSVTVPSKSQLYFLNLLCNSIQCCIDIYSSILDVVSMNAECQSVSYVCTLDVMWYLKHEHQCGQCYHSHKVTPRWRILTPLVPPPYPQTQVQSHPTCNYTLQLFEVVFPPAKWHCVIKCISKWPNPLLWTEALPWMPLKQLQRTRVEIALLCWPGIRVVYGRRTTCNSHLFLGLLRQMEFVDLWFEQYRFWNVFLLSAWSFVIHQFSLWYT